MTSIPLTPETQKIASEILIEGKMNGINGPVPPFKQCFNESESVTAKHVLWEDFVKATGCQIPKIFGYLTMDEVFGQCTGKDSQGYAGYHLQCNLSTY